MKKIFCIFLLLFSFKSFAQQAKSLQISVGYGFPESTYYYYGSKPSKATAYNFDFDYFITSKHILSVNYSYLEKRYFNDYSAQLVAIGVKPLIPYENSEVVSNFFSLLYKYKAIEYKKLSLTVGTGIGLGSQNVQEPYLDGGTGGVRTQYYQGMGIYMPFRLELSYAFQKKFSVGILSGMTYSLPSFDILVTRFVQPKVSFHF